MNLNSIFKILIQTFILSLSISSSYAKPLSDKELDDYVSKQAQAFVSNNHLPGIALGVYYEGEEHFYNFGYANLLTKTPVSKHTIFNLGSITKVFVSTLLALKVQENQVKLNEPIDDFFPSLAKFKNNPIGQVTFQNLATHTSSFPRQLRQFGVEPGDINGLIQVLKQWKPQYPVGSHYSYSNVGFGLLGVALTKVTNVTLPKLLSKYITKPLWMEHTYFHLPEDLTSFKAQGYTPQLKPAQDYVPRNFLGGGALLSSTEDMMQFMKANLNIKIGSAPASLYSAIQLTQLPYFKVSNGFVMGLGWQRIQYNQYQLITKNGAVVGFSSFIGFSPEKHLGVIVLINQYKGKASQLGNKILHDLVSQSN